MAAAMLISGPGLAQQTDQVPEPTEALPQGTAGEAPANPHQMLDVLSGGPDGSPTARRGNPRPGTSTSIPTTNPATVHPLPAPAGEAASTENTGIDGQCDPVVGFRDCPPRPAPAGMQAGEASGAPQEAESPTSQTSNEASAGE